MSKHTPTPWGHSRPRAGKVGGHEIVAVNSKFGYAKLICMCSHHPGKQDEAEANAEFIVRAVNNHEDLLKQLRWSARNVHESNALLGNDVHRVPFQDCMARCCQDNRTVIARAEGDTHE